VSDDPKDYTVGYGKPPKSTQFQKGKSGNPNGRPKGAKNQATIMREISNEKVPFKEGNRTKTATREQIVCRQMVNKAMTGDTQARRDYFGRMDSIREAEGDTGYAGLNRENENRIAEHFLNRRDRLKPQTKAKSDDDDWPLNVIR